MRVFHSKLIISSNLRTVYSAMVSAYINMTRGAEWREGQVQRLTPTNNKRSSAMLREDGYHVARRPEWIKSWIKRKPGIIIRAMRSPTFLFDLSNSRYSTNPWLIRRESRSLSSLSQAQPIGKLTAEVGGSRGRWLAHLMVHSLPVFAQKLLTCLCVEGITRNPYTRVQILSHKGTNSEE